MIFPKNVKRTFASSERTIERNQAIHFNCNLILIATGRVIYLTTVFDVMYFLAPVVNILYVYIKQQYLYMRSSLCLYPCDAIAYLYLFFLFQIQFINDATS